MAEPTSVKLQWALQIAMGALIAIGGYVWSGTVSDLRALRKDVNDQAIKIAVLEGDIRVQAQRYDGVRELLTRLEKKIDDVLAREQGPPQPSFRGRVQFDK